LVPHASTSSCNAARERTDDRIIKSKAARTDVIGDNVSGSGDNINRSNKNRVFSRHTGR